MNAKEKLLAGKAFPEMVVPTLEGEMELGKPAAPCDWQMVVVYRGRHCPLCTKFLNQLETYRERLQLNNVDVVDISNNPFVRPELESLVNGLDWIRNPENHYPIRGTWRG